MTIRGTYNDYDRKTYRHITFEVWDHLPAKGETYDETAHNFVETVEDYIDITNDVDMKSVDEGYYSLYKLWTKRNEYTLDDNDNEVVGEESKEERYIAVWTPYGEED